MTDQLTSIEGLSAEEIAKATREGRLDALLSGDRDAIAMAKAEALIAERAAAAEEAKPTKVDMGAQGGPREPRYDEAWLATASPAAIAKATREGKLRDLL